MSSPRLLLQSLPIFLFAMAHGDSAHAVGALYLTEEDMPLHELLIALMTAGALFTYIKIKKLTKGLPKPYPEEYAQWMSLSKIILVMGGLTLLMIFCTYASRKFAWIDYTSDDNLWYVPNRHAPPPKYGTPLFFVTEAECKASLRNKEDCVLGKELNRQLREFQQAPFFPWMRK